MANILKQLFRKENDTTNDDLGAYPHKVHVPAFPERRYLKTSRVLAVLSIISVCIAMMIASVIFVMPSMVKNRPVPLFFSPTIRSFDYMERIEVHKGADEIIMETFIREYIDLKYTVIPDVEKMQETWGPRRKFFWYSSNPVFQRHTSVDMPRVISKIQTNGYRREVYFRWTRYLRPSRWSAEFDTYEYFGWQRSSAIRKRWRAFMKVGYNQKRTYPDYVDKMYNPLGFTMYEFNVVSIEIRDKDEF